MSEHAYAVPPKKPAPPRRGGKVEKPKDMRGTLLRLWQLTKGARKGLIWILLLAALSSAAAVFSPDIAGQAVTAISNRSPLAGWLLCLAALYFGDWLVKFLQQVLMASVSQRIVHRIRVVLFEKLVKMPLSYYDANCHGELMSRLTNDIDNISTTMSDSATQLLTFSFTIVGVLVMMLRLSPALTPAALLGAIVILPLARFFTRRTKKLYLARQRALGQLDAQIEESISGIREVKLFCRSEECERDFNERNDEMCRTATEAGTISGYLMPLMGAINNICFLVIAVLSGFLLVKGYITSVGLITSFLLYVRQFNRPFVEIANVYNMFQTAVAGTERVLEVLDGPEEPADSDLPAESHSIKGEIVFSHVSFGYDPGYPVLKDLCLRVTAGTRIAIVGPTGSGKTTLVNLLTRFYEVNSGYIALDGTNIRNYALTELRNIFGVVLQDTALFSRSVADNIRYGHPNADMEKVHQAAEAAGADTFISQLPQGYDTVLSQGGLELSQGERQLLTIARAILTDAPILILDEATSSVDTVTEKKIYSAMQKLCSGRTSFLIAHRLSTIRDADWILFLENGKIIEQGTHEQLLAAGGKYAELVHLQSGNEASI